MSRRYENADGIDARFDRAWDEALREDAERTAQATAPKCKRCSREFPPLTQEQRADYHTRMWTALHGEIDYTGSWNPAAVPPTLERQPGFAIGRARVYAAWLVAADRGWCSTCADHIERPAP